MWEFVNSNDYLTSLQHFAELGLVMPTKSSIKPPEPIALLVPIECLQEKVHINNNIDKHISRIAFVAAHMIRSNGRHKRQLDRPRSVAVLHKQLQAATRFDAPLHRSQVNVLFRCALYIYDKII